MTVASCHQLECRCLRGALATLITKRLLCVLSPPKVVVLFLSCTPHSLWEVGLPFCLCPDFLLSASHLLLLRAGPSPPYVRARQGSCSKRQTSCHYSAAMYLPDPCLSLDASALSCGESFTLTLRPRSPESNACGAGCAAARWPLPQPWLSVTCSSCHNHE